MKPTSNLKQKITQTALYLSLSLLLILSGCANSTESVTTSSPGEQQNNLHTAASAETDETDGEKSNQPAKIEPAVSIKIGYPTQGASMLPLWVAKDTGLLEKYGINAELIYIAGTPKVQEVLTSNGIQVGVVGVDAVGKSKAAGHDSVIISALADRVALYVYGQKDAKAADLKNNLSGQTLITAAEGSLYDHLAQAFVREHGLIPGQDVKMLYMGGEGDRTAAFLNGEGAYYVVAPPISFKMDELGYQQVFDFVDMEVLLAGIGMTRQYYEQNPQVAKSIVAALIEANAVILHDRQQAIQSIMHWTGIDDAELAEKTYEMHKPTIPQKPYISDKAVQFFLENSTNDQVKEMKPEELVDNRIVQEMDESGWIDRIYQQ